MFRLSNVLGFQLILLLQVCRHIVQFPIQIWGATFFRYTHLNSLEKQLRYPPHPVEYTGDVPLLVGYHGYFGAVRRSAGRPNTFRPRLRISALDA